MVKTDFASHSWCPQTRNLTNSSHRKSSSWRQTHTFQLQFVTAHSAAISNVTLKATAVNCTLYFRRPKSLSLATCRVLCYFSCTKVQLELFKLLPQLFLIPIWTPYSSVSTSEHMWICNGLILYGPEHQQCDSFRFRTLFTLTEMREWTIIYYKF
jgi:hypothetical protein